MGHTMKCDKCKKLQRWSSDLIEVSESKKYMWKVECQNMKCKHINHFWELVTKNDKMYKAMIMKSIQDEEEY